MGDRGAELIGAAYAAWRDEFRAITRRARFRFSSRDWPGALSDQVERLALYRAVLDTCIAGLDGLLGERLRDREVWAAMKTAFAAGLARQADPDLAETFFNSATRRIFSTVGVDSSIEFVSMDAPPPKPAAAFPVVDLYEGGTGRTSRTVLRILESISFPCGWEDLEGDAVAAARVVDRAVAAAWGGPGFDSAEVLRPVFYRSKGAYVVGRLRKGTRTIPLVFALRNPGKVVVDAVLTDEDDVSIVFSFTRSYFKVDADSAEGIVGFLREVMPRKPLGELYNAVGHEKHGKTELYRDVLRHLARSDDRFVLAAGEKGMVMAVFTLPGLDVVFKVIRDTFPPPKTTTREKVMASYRLVRRHGRAGRMVDAQEFEHLEFDRERFDPECLADLTGTAAETVTVEGGRVEVRHLFTERRVVPLNLHLACAPEAEQRRAALDFGQCLKDLVATNVFPGDLLLKNFGVTRHGRVVFYDYDEISPLTDIVFRDLPSSGDDDDDDGWGGGSEPSFFVGEHDVFPEEFGTFLGMRGAAREAFLSAHADLLTASWWRGLQQRVRAGEIVDIYPYPDAVRIRRPAGPS